MMPSLLLLITIAETPLGVVGREVVFGECWCAVAYGVEYVFLVDAALSWNALWHYAECAVGELLDAPKLFGCACESRDGGEFQIGCGGKGALCAFDNDLIVRTSQIASRLRYGSDCPTLMRAEHVVADADTYVAFRPCGFDIVEFLVCHWQNLLIRVETPPCLALLLDAVFSSS